MRLTYDPPHTLKRQHETRGATHNRNPKGEKTCLFIRKHDHFSPTRDIRRHVRALARNPEGRKLQGHVSPTPTVYLSYMINTHTNTHTHTHTNTHTHTHTHTQTHSLAPPPPLAHTLTLSRHNAGGAARVREEVPRGGYVAFIDQYVA